MATENRRLKPWFEYFNQPIPNPDLLSSEGSQIPLDILGVFTQFATIWQGHMAEEIDLLMKESGSISSYVKHKDSPIRVFLRNDVEVGSLESLLLLDGSIVEKLEYDSQPGLNLRVEKIIRQPGQGYELIETVSYRDPNSNDLIRTQTITVNHPADELENS